MLRPSDIDLVRGRLDLAISFAPSQHKSISIWAEFHALPCSNSGMGYHALKDSTKRLCPLRARRNGQHSPLYITAILCRFYLFLTHLPRSAPQTPILHPLSSRRNRSRKPIRVPPLRNSAELRLMGRVIHANARPCEGLPLHFGNHRRIKSSRMGVE